MAYELIVSVKGPDSNETLVGSADLGDDNRAWDFFGVWSDGWLLQQSATITTGELRLVPDDDRGVLRQIRMRATLDGTAGKVPGVVAAVRAHDRAAWTWIGDSNGVITVGTDSVTGVGTAWSNCIAIGDDAEATFTLPAPAAKCRFYLDSTPLTDGYTATGSTIVLDSPLADGVKLYAYWYGEPQITASVGDYVFTTQGFHRVLTIPTATTATLEWYPTEELTGTHCIGRDLAPGESQETVLPANQTFNTLQLKLVVTPRVVSDNTYCKIDALELEWLAGKKRHLKTGV